MAKTDHDVLVGCPIHPADTIYVEGFIESMKSQDYPHLRIIFAETSGDKEFFKLLERTGELVLSARPDKDGRMEKIIAGREKIRQYFLEHDDYYSLWFVDADVRPPSDALSKLIKADKDVISGVCLSHFNVGGKRRVLPCLYRFTDEKGVCQQLNRQEVSGSGVEEIAVAGFGCVLVKRRVLEKIAIRRFAEGGGEDAAFFIDSLKAGFKNFVNKGVKCAHLVYEPGDARNREFELL